jgi:hypothetical protein
LAFGEWFVRLESSAPLPGSEVADLLAGYGVFTRRSQDGDFRSTPSRAWLLTHRCESDRVHAAIAALHAATGCRGSAWPSLPSLEGSDD